MALGTYAELQASIADWLKRTDMATVIPDFVKLAESRLNTILRVPQMETRATASLTGEYIAVPEDFLAVRSITIQGARDLALEYLAPKHFYATNRANLSGSPCYYTILDEQFVFAPIPASGTVEIIYFRSLPALATNSTNWLLTAFPQCYLHGSLVQAYSYLRDDAQVARSEAQFAAAVSAVSLDGERRRGPDALRMQSRHQV